MLNPIQSDRPHILTLIRPLVRAANRAVPWPQIADGMLHSAYLRVATTA